MVFVLCFNDKYLEISITTKNFYFMDSFPQIYGLFSDLYNELANLKKELENDLNYSVQHAEIVDFVDDAEDALEEVEKQIRAIESDVDILTDALENRNDEEDEDEREVRMYSPEDEE
jgi:vacuolar-type H+-ATPase subunit I/STV1